MRPASSALLVTFISLAVIACESPGGGGGYPMPYPDATTGTGAETAIPSEDGAVATFEDTAQADSGPGPTSAPPDATTTSAPPDTTTTTEPPEDTSDPADDAVPSVRTCTPITLATEAPALSYVEDVTWIFGAESDLGFGGSAPDWFGLEFFDDALGSFDLAIDDQLGGECERCTLLAVDSGTSNERYFRPIRGTLAVSAPASGAKLIATYLDVDFADETDLENGTCYHVDYLYFEGARGCSPSCGGKVCGDDGCGGTCGDCAGGTACNESGSACVATAPPGCSELAVSGPLTVEGAGAFYIEPFAGDGVPRRLYVQVFTPDLGFFDLASAVNDNYATCEQCVLFFTDEAPDKVYFQTSGTISIAEGSDPLGATPRLDAQLAGVELREVTIDAGTYQSTLVPGGACFTVPLAWVSTE